MFFSLANTIARSATGGTTFGVSGLVLGFLMPKHSSCYMDKFAEAMMEIMDEKIVQNNVNVMRAKLRGWADTFCGIQSNHKERMVGLSDDMNSDKYKIFVNKHAAPLIARDYLNFRISLFLDIVRLSTSKVPLNVNAKFLEN